MMVKGKSHWLKSTFCKPKNSESKTVRAMHLFYCASGFPMNEVCCNSLGCSGNTAIQLELSISQVDVSHLALTYGEPQAMHLTRGVNQLI